MNTQSIILLSVVLGLAGWALYLYIKKNRRTGGCGSCNCYDCALRNVQSKKSSKYDQITPRCSEEHGERQRNADCSKQ